MCVSYFLQEIKTNLADFIADPLISINNFQMRISLDK